MKSEHRAILAIVLSALFFIVWSYFLSPKKDPAPPEVAAATSEATAAGTETPSVAGQLEGGAPKVEARETQGGAQDPQGNVEHQEIRLQNGLVEMTVRNDGGTLSGWRLLEYTETTKADSPKIDLAQSDPALPRSLATPIHAAGIQMPERPMFEVLEADDAHVLLSWQSPALEVRKTITLEPESYVANVELEIQNRSEQAVTIKPAMFVSTVTQPQEQKKGLFSFLKRTEADIKQPIYYLDGKAHRSKEVDKEVTVSGALYWSGIDSRYFLSAVIPRVQGDGLAAQYGGKPLPDRGAGVHGIWADAELPSQIVPPGESTRAAFSLYAGPKDIERLKAMGVRLEDAIDYGWFTVIAIPILYLLKFFYSVIHNYGVAIILLTIFVKLLLHPINIKSLKSMKAMQQLQPRLKEIQQKYKDDKPRLNQETMQLFRAHKVNPMGGCLPMVLQLPIYIALYKVLWSSIELYHAPFFWFYRDLSAPDPYLITPILLGVFMLLQQMLMPSTSADPAQKKMMMLMPIMFTGFMLFLPVGLVIYILVNTAMSVTQQWMYNHGIGLMDLIRGRLAKKAE